MQALVGLMRPGEELSNRRAEAQTDLSHAQKASDRNKGASEQEGGTTSRTLRDMDLLEEDEREREREAQNDTRKLVGEAQMPAAVAAVAAVGISLLMGCKQLESARGFAKAVPRGIGQQCSGSLSSRLFKRSAIAPHC
jgi:hypothetical protein